MILCMRQTVIKSQCGCSQPFPVTLLFSALANSWLFSQHVFAPSESLWFLTFKELSLPFPNLPQISLVCFRNADVWGVENTGNRGLITLIQLMQTVRGALPYINQRVHPGEQTPERGGEMKVLNDFRESQHLFRSEAMIKEFRTPKGPGCGLRGNQRSGRNIGIICLVIRGLNLFIIRQKLTGKF